MVAVVDLPLSAMDDPSPFVPPSQYEVGGYSAHSYRFCYVMLCFVLL